MPLNVPAPVPERPIPGIGASAALSAEIVSVPFSGFREPGGGATMLGFPPACGCPGLASLRLR